MPSLADIVIFAALILAACDQPPEPRQLVEVDQGEASIYGDKFEGRKTASGERFSQDKPMAAHPALRLGSTAKVTNTETGQSTEVEILDRGPHAKGRVIDLSKSAAEQIGLEDGTAPVKVEQRRSRASRGEPSSACDYGQSGGSAGRPFITATSGQNGLSRSLQSKNSCRKSSLPSKPGFHASSKNRSAASKLPE